MQKTRGFILLVLLCCTFFTSTTGQIKIKNKGTPFIYNYDPDGYKADGQSWGVVQGKQGLIYIGCSAGLLEYDGTHWVFITLPNKTTVRSLTLSARGQVYIGGKGEIGYLKADSLGQSQYVSLLPKIPEKDRAFSDVWRAYTTNEGIVLQAFKKMFVVDKNNHVKVYSPDSGFFHRSFWVNNRLLVRQEGKGLLELKNGQLQPVSGGELFADELVYVVLAYDDTHLMVVSRTRGIWLYDGKEFTPWKTDADDFLKKNSSYCGINIGKDYFALGTLLGGIVIINKQGQIVQHIDKSKGLQASTILNMYIDREDNLWAVMENGISRIEVASPVSFFKQHNGFKGVIYTTFLHNERLYLGTSQGIYYANWNKGGQFKNLGHTTTQIWEFKDTPLGILASSNDHIYHIKDDECKRLENAPIANFWQAMPLINQPYLLAGTSNKGLVLIDAKTNKVKRVISGFTQAARWMEQDSAGVLWISNKYSKGVFRVELSPDLRKVNHQKLYNIKNGLPAINGNRIFKVNNEVLIATPKGVYVFKNDRFEPHKYWNNYLGGETVQVHLIREGKKGTVCFLISDNTVYNSPLRCVVVNKTGKTKIIAQPFAPLSSLITNAWALVIEPINQKEIMFAIKDGLAHYDASIYKNYQLKFETLLRKVEVITPKDSLLFGGGLVSSSKTTVVNYEQNALRFEVAATFFQESNKTQFQYFLEGFDIYWSDWSRTTRKEYNYLPEGTYTFRVRAKNIYGVVGKEVSYKFIIQAPWYRTNLAYTFYILFIIAIIIMAVRLNSHRLRRHNEYLEHIVVERTTKVVEQKRKIEMQRDNLIELNQEVNQKNEEITAQNEALGNKTNDLKAAFDEIKRQNADITAGIAYAYRIQKAMLPVNQNIRKAFPQHFILWQPRDIVSGDFYWFASIQTDDGITKNIIAVVDCTGHGVPGAFMSMIGNDLLNTIVKANKITSADEILNKLHMGVKLALKQETTQNEDGMDIALVVVDETNDVLEFAGAHHPLIYAQNNEQKVIRGNEYPIGRRQIEDNPKYGKQKIDISQPTVFYLFSDGYQDQFGGPKGKKFMRQRFWDLLHQLHNLPMQAQKETLDITFQQWKKNYPQIDDMLVLGVKLNGRLTVNS